MSCLVLSVAFGPVGRAAFRSGFYMHIAELSSTLSPCHSLALPLTEQESSPSVTFHRGATGSTETGVFICYKSPTLSCSSLANTRQMRFQL